MVFFPSFLYNLLSMCWRKCFRHIKPLAVFVEKRICYPSLGHITRQAHYPDGPILIAGFFQSGIGQGTGASWYYKALRKENKEVFAIDISSAFSLADTQADIPLCSVQEAPRHGILVMHCNAPEMGRALQYLGIELTQNRKIVGYWAWELEVSPIHWHRAYKYCDEIWVPSHFTAKAFAHSPIPVTVVPHRVKDVVDGGHSRQDLGLPKSIEKSILFLTMADCRSDLIRKNIYGSVKAFVSAAGNTSTAALVVKLHHTEFAGAELERIRSLCHAYMNVYILETLLTTAECASLLHRCDVMLSLHRSEGYGLHLAEALSIGKMLIATNWSGNVDFMTTENCILVPYTLIQVYGDTPNYQKYTEALWADADVDFAAQCVQSILARTEGS